MMAEPLLSVRLLIVAALVTSVAAGCQETCNAAYSDCLMSCQSNPACINPCQRNTCKIDLVSGKGARTPVQCSKHLMLPVRRVLVPLLAITTSLADWTAPRPAKITFLSWRGWSDDTTEVERTRSFDV
ncbi:hypothetical protein BKA81DRAFT_34855 [Phyllosticta paracitricarpa]|uniref:Uncharacterized protein n=2 Tax=Phyllosticta TaxID=121621 RepID=A0ABR1MC08_9PEZI